MIGVLTSVVGAYYYLRIIKVMYFDAPSRRFDPRAGLAVDGRGRRRRLFTTLFFAVAGADGGGGAGGRAVLFG